MLCGVVCGLSCGIGVELNSRFGRTLSLVRRQESPVRVIEEESSVGLEVCFFLLLIFLLIYLFRHTDRLVFPLPKADLAVVPNKSGK